jgi:hypothetical protein
MLLRATALIAAAVGAATFCAVAPVVHADPTDPTDVAFVQALKAQSMPVLKSYDDMVKRGQGIASYMSQNLNADAMDTVYRNNENDGLTFFQVNQLVTDAANYYAPNNRTAILALMREHWAAHLKEQQPRPGTASGSSCDGAGCVPNVNQNVVPNGTCTPKSRYDFGMDSGGKPYVCLSIGSWTAAPPLVGVRTMGSRCSGQLSAQSPDGIAMLCMDGVWTHGDDIPA